MPHQITIHAVPETFSFVAPTSTPPFTNSTERQPFTIARPPLPVGCLWTAMGFTMKAHLSALNGLSGPDIGSTYLVVGGRPFIETFYNASWFSTSSVSDGAGGFFVEYSINVFSFAQTTASFRAYCEANPSASATLAFDLHYGSRRRSFDVTELTMILVSDDACPPGDDGGGEDGGGGDDDDSPGASGQYRAIEADSVRSWIHIGQGTGIRTYHTLPMTSAFASGSHGASIWKQFCANPRNGGTLACLGRVGTGESAVFLSTDGGQTSEEVHSVTGTSVVMDYDSEREWLVVLKEGAPADPESDTSHGTVTREVAEDFGQTFQDRGGVTMGGNPLQARLLGMTYDPRTGGTLYLLCKILGVTKILASTDGGNTWEVRRA